MGTNKTMAPNGACSYEEMVLAVGSAPEKAYLDKGCYVDFAKPEIHCGDLIETKGFKGHRANILQALVACRNRSLSKADLGYYLAAQNNEDRDQIPVKSAVKKSYDAVSYIRKRYCKPFCGNREKCIRDEDGRYWFSPSENFRVLEEATLTAQFSGVWDEDQQASRHSYLESVLPCGHYQDRSELKELLEKAFSNHAGIHVISGEHGAGKSELARAFSAACNHENQEIRPELRYKFLYFTHYSSGGLRETIASLPSSGSFDAGKNLYTEKLRLLSDTEKPCLLVIDNCDRPLAEDFTSDSPVYRELLATGCHVLITSRQDLGRLYGLPQTRLNPMSLSALSRLFCSVSGQDVAENDPRLVELLDTLLHHNPYLIVLAARLAQVRPLDEMIAAFKSSRARALDDPIDTTKDRSRTTARRLIDHARTLFDLDGQKLRSLEWKILYNLMLPPPSGVLQTQFLHDAFAPEEQDEVRQALVELRYQNLVLLRNQKLVLPGLVRELLQEQFSSADIPLVERYLSSIDDQIHVEIHHDRLEPYMELATGCEILRDLNPVPVIYALLISDLASDYGMLDQPEKAYYFAKLAADLLDRIPVETCTREEKLSIAVAYNNTGYSVYHNRRHNDAGALAERVFRNADQLVSQLLAESSENGLRLARLQAKIHGNMGAALLARKKYAEALELHLRSVSFREELFQEHPIKEVALLLATAYRSTGSDYYYYSKVCSPDAALEKLLQSCRYYQKAINLYDTHFEASHHETIIAYNRYTTGFCAALTEWSRRPSLESLSVPFVQEPYETLVALMDQMHLSVKTLIEQFPDNKELVNSVKNTRKLLSAAKRVHYTDSDFLDTAHEIYGLLQVLPYTDASPERNAAFDQLEQALDQFDQF